MLLVRDFHSICASLLVSFRDGDSYEQLQRQGAAYMQNFLNLLQEVCRPRQLKHLLSNGQVIDFPDLPTSFRTQCIRRMIHLCRKSAQHPECLCISGLQRIGDYAVTSGGYGDVWKGLLRGQCVSVKVLKIYQNSSLRALLKVCLLELLNVAI